MVVKNNCVCIYIKTRPKMPHPPLTTASVTCFRDTKNNILAVTTKQLDECEMCVFVRGFSRYVYWKYCRNCCYTERQY